MIYEPQQDPRELPSVQEFDGPVERSKEVDGSERSRTRDQGGRWSAGRRRDPH